MGYVVCPPLVAPLVMHGPARGELSPAKFLALQYTLTLVYFNSSLNPILTAGRSQMSDKQRRTQSENYFVHQVKSYEMICAGIGSLV